MSWWMKPCSVCRGEAHRAGPRDDFERAVVAGTWPRTSRRARRCCATGFHHEEESKSLPRRRPVSPTMFGVLQPGGDVGSRASCCGPFGSPCSWGISGERSSLTASVRAGAAHRGAGPLSYRAAANLARPGGNDRLRGPDHAGDRRESSPWRLFASTAPGPGRIRSSPEGAMPHRIPDIQAWPSPEAELDGWLFAVFQANDPIAAWTCRPPQKSLGPGAATTSSPTPGEPRKLCRDARARHAEHHLPARRRSTDLAAASSAAGASGA